MRMLTWNVLKRTIMEPCDCWSFLLMPQCSTAPTMGLGLDLTLSRYVGGEVARGKPSSWRLGLWLCSWIDVVDMSMFLLGGCFPCDICVTMLFHWSDNSYNCKFCWMMLIFKLFQKEKKCRNITYSSPTHSRKVKKVHKFFVFTWRRPMWFFSFLLECMEERNPLQRKSQKVQKKADG